MKHGIRRNPSSRRAPIHPRRATLRIWRKPRSVDSHCANPLPQQRLLHRPAVDDRARDSERWDLTKIHVHGHLPLFVFAEKVILDSRGRFDYGNWVRSPMAISFQDGFLFETKNTVYVLVGDGDEKSASLAAILSLYQ